MLDWLVHIKNIQDLQTASKVTIGVLALATGVGELITATSWVVRGIAALETTVAASDLLLMNITVRNGVKGCFATPQEGEDFLKSYENITLILNGAAATYGLTRLFKTDVQLFHERYTARKTTIDASSAVSADAKAALNKLDDAIVDGKVGDVVAGVGWSFRVGDVIAGKQVVNVKPGTNGKIAVIGRQMDDHVNNVASHLKNNQGLQVEILDDAYLNRTFNIDGVEWTVNSAWDDMVNNGAYDYMKDPVTGHIKAEYIKQIPMYKLNKQWIEYVQSEGFTIIDIGYPPGLTTESLFYNMEINTINW